MTFAEFDEASKAYAKASGHKVHEHQVRDYLYMLIANKVIFGSTQAKQLRPSKILKDSFGQLDAAIAQHGYSILE